MAIPLLEFKRLILEPNLNSLMLVHDKLHIAFNAVSSVDSYSAHLFQAIQEVGVSPMSILSGEVRGDNDISFRELLAAHSKDFGLIRDVAKANKHAILFRGNPQVNGSGDTILKPRPFGTGSYGLGPYGGVEEWFVRTLDGKEHHLQTALVNAVDFIDALAVEHNLI